MPWSGTGVFNRTDGTRTGATVWAQAKAAGVKVVASGHDAHDEDIADGLEACWNRNGENALTADVSAGGFSITNLADAAAAGEAVAYDQASVRFTSTDAGASAAPVLTLYRNSASPATDDVLGELRFDGEDSAGNQQEYANIATQIAVSTSGSESGRLLFNLVIAGTERTIFRLGPTADARLSSFDAGASAGPTFTLHRNSSSPADGDVIGEIEFDGEDDGDAQTTYAAIEAVAEDVTDATEDGYLQFRYMRAGSAVTSLAPGIFKSAATTSGTTSDIADIPANARKITISLNGVSTNGTNNLLLQLGDSDGIETTGYLGCAGQIAATNASETSGVTNGLLLTDTAAAAATYSGVYTLLRSSDGLSWSLGGSYAEEASSAGTKVGFAGGKKAVSATLTTLRLTTSGTPDTFDAGSWNILIE